MRTGLVSITFRQLGPQQIVDLVAQADLDGIEWGGDVHAPHGDVDTARRVAQMTRDAGLDVIAYGSYYRVCASDDLSFDHVIDSARALGTDLVRIWAGRGTFAEMTEDYRKRVADETRRFADRAADAGLTLAFEYHRGTLTETADSARRLLEEVDRPNVKSLWQPDPRLSVDENDAALRAVLPWVVNLHVFSWDSAGTRLPLADGEAWWARYLATAKESGRDHAALIEFVTDAEPDNFLADARTLRQWLRK
ncbi:MAG: sugar phosphate isomerase/epimerase family protein [Phycisphaeraceae bacterium]